MIMRRVVNVSAMGLMILALTQCNRPAPESSGKTEEVTAAKQPIPQTGKVTTLDATASSLERTTWALKGALAGAPVDLLLQDGKLSGQGGVNRFAGSYTLNGESLKLGALATTRRAGPQEAMEQEREFLAKLALVSQHRIAGEELSLRDGDGDTLLVFTPVKQVGLSAVEWRATGINNGKGGVASVLNGVEITARFDGAGALSGSAGCNNYTGRYESAEETLKASSIALTRKMCAGPAGVMEQEGSYTTALGKVAKYHIDGDTLELRSDKGSLQVRFKAQR